MFRKLLWVVLQAVADELRFHVRRALKRRPKRGKK